MGFTNGISKREEPTREPKRERRRNAKARLNTCGLIKFIIKEKTKKITPRAREPGEMCRGKMKSLLGVVKLGILRLRLSGGGGGGWMRAGVGSSGAVVSCLGGDGGRIPPVTLATLTLFQIFSATLPSLNFLLFVSLYKLLQI